MNALTSHNNVGSAENQQPLIDDNHLQKLSKTGSFLSHLAREFSGGRASSSAASDSPAMKSSSRNNSSGSHNSSGAPGRRIMRKQQHSCSESSVGEEAREIEEVQSRSTATPSATITSNEETFNENESKMVGYLFSYGKKETISFLSNQFFFQLNEKDVSTKDPVANNDGDDDDTKVSLRGEPSNTNASLEHQSGEPDQSADVEKANQTTEMHLSSEEAETRSTVESQDAEIVVPVAIGKNQMFFRSFLK